MHPAPRRAAAFSSPCRSVLLGLAVAGAGAADLFGPDDFTGYTRTSDTATMLRELVTTGPWSGFDHSGNVAIDAYPGDPAKQAFMIRYVHSDDSGALARQFQPLGSASRPRGVVFSWREWRSSSFDFGPSKDMRMPSYRAGEHRGMDGAVLLDIYMVFANPSPAGVGACTVASINKQGTPIHRDLTYGDENIVVNKPFVLQRGVDHAMRWEVLLNTPGHADGRTRLWVDGTLVLERTAVKWYADGWAQFYVDDAQIGMTATNGGQDFAAVSQRWVTDVAMATVLTAPANAAPVASSQGVVTAAGTAKAITLMASDADGDALTYAIATAPAHGTLSGAGAGRTYTPAIGYSGGDGFTFRANDGTADSNAATVAITVTAAADPGAGGPPEPSGGSAGGACGAGAGALLAGMLLSGRLRRRGAAS